MEALEAIFRWLHVFAGITWIGHLYFFNWVNGPLQAKLDGPTKKVVVPELMPRALYWFRWGAAYTWFTGVLLLMLVYYAGQQALASGASWSPGALIMIAVTFIAPFIYDALCGTFYFSALLYYLRCRAIFGPLDLRRSCLFLALYICALNLIPKMLILTTCWGWR